MIYRATSCKFMYSLTICIHTCQSLFKILILIWAFKSTSITLPLIKNGLCFHISIKTIKRASKIWAQFSKTKFFRSDDNKYIQLN